jgi:hypothetical protein
MNINHHYLLQFSELSIDNLIYILENFENKYPGITNIANSKHYSYDELLGLNVNINYVNNMISISGAIIDIVSYLINPFLIPILNNIGYYYNQPLHLENVHIRLDQEQFKKNIHICRVKKNDTIEVCSICQEDMNYYAFKGVTNCGHHFHRKCIKDWTTKFCEKPHCPLCRNDLRNPISQ